MFELDYRESVLREERFFAKPVLRCVEHLTIRVDLDESRRRIDRRGWDILKLERHNVNAPCELPDLVEIAIVGDRLDIGDLTCGRVAVGREGVDAEAHFARFDSEHAAELAAAENTDS
jgi:hypothetical protein